MDNETTTTTAPTHEDLVAHIAVLAPQAAATQAELDAAIKAERDAEAAVLARAIELARPALRSICYRLKSLHRISGIATDRWREVVDHHPLPGLHLDGDSKADRDAPRDNNGVYEGRGLYLLADGTLAVREWSGSWSRWQGATDEEETTLEPVSARDAMDEWDLGDCLESLRDALRKVADGKAPERAKAARERAERLAAVAALVK